ncbi:thermonuclease family protein [Domibacillus indicus]|uniref:thermonuclease family protein n=1 Tax=Domibacillus indicus TaxID=1437523 RepID=UPI00203E666D|nr:thermonuclease family protein [Domibacillus indicus]MCM3788193.1 thermonuclease family protein [Domibacillus indicus]
MLLKKKLFKPVAASLLSVSLLAGSFTPAFNDLSSQTAEAALPKTATKVTVNEVVDGDTIKVTYKGRAETVRMILIDTPETKDPKKCVQLYGPEATAYTKKYLLDKTKTVSIEFDKDTRDQYGRLLAYVYVNETMFNELLIQNGLARIAVFEPNTKYLKKLQESENKAKSAKKGIWSNSNAIKGGCAPKPAPAPVKPAPKPTPAPAPKPVPKPAPAPKKETFKNCTELRKKYPNGVKKGHPAYDTKHDRDKDGWACER